MTEVARNYEIALPGLLAKISEDLSSALGVRLEFDVEQAMFRPTQEILAALSPGAVMCRSRYIKNSSGIGGVLFSQEAAGLIARAATDQNRSEEETFSFDGPVSTVMTELWNVFLGAWNRLADPDFRFSAKKDERSVEHYPSSIRFPETAGPGIGPG